MSYRELQSILSQYRNLGYTNIALNSKKSVLLAELIRIEAEQKASAAEQVDESIWDEPWAQEPLCDRLLDEPEAPVHELEREPQEIEYLAEELILDGDFDESQLVNEWVAENAPTSCPLPEPDESLVTAEPLALPEAEMTSQEVIDQLEATVAHLDELANKVLEKHQPLPTTPTVVKQPIFHRKRSGLLHSIVHLAQCTAIMVNRMGDNHPPRVPVVRMPGKYQRAWA